MAISWSEAMKVGIELVDEDHRMLFSIVAEFEAIVKQDDSAAGAQALGQTLAKLQDYVRDHFEREEQIQLEAKYDGYEENKRQHQELTRTLESFIARQRDGSLGEAVAIARMRDFLAIWLTEHILRTDRRMRGRILPWAG